MKISPRTTFPLALAWNLLFLTGSSGKIYERVEDLPTLDYDFIVVGGGTAGNVIANRLTENPKFSVLVLEAGGSNEGVQNSIVPYFCINVAPGTPYDWNYTTVAQTGLGGRSIPYTSGHILGGGSSVNIMIHTRGSSEDFDRYATVTGDAGWSWNQVQQYFSKNEKWTQPADHHNTKGQYDPSIHSTRGINAVSLVGYQHPIDDLVIQTTKELSSEFPFNLDTNSGKPLGLGWMQTTVDGSKRSSSATSYLGPNFINRPNLSVLVRAQVTRLLQTNSSNGTLAFQAVEFAQSVGGNTTRATASKELILSAGSVGTPRILLNSGIGDQAALTALGIKPLLDLPDVGRNLSDHPLLSSAWAINATNIYADLNRNATLAAGILQQWTNTGTGPFVGTLLDHVAWLRLPNNASIFGQYPDPAAGPNTPHFELLISSGIAHGQPPNGSYMAIGTNVVSPVSRGSVKLATNNPFDLPIIDPGVLASDFDIFTMREAVKSAQRFLTAPAWKGYVLGPINGLENVTTDAQLDQYIRSRSYTMTDSVGTASMSPKGVKYGVVDPDLRVKGVQGLRIVDASVLPFVPSGHTQSPVYVVAERASDLIKASW